MYVSKILCLALFSVLLLSVCCQVGYSEYTVLNIDDLPVMGESLVIETHSILTINQGETAIIEGNLYVNGTDGAIIDVQIMNYGELTIKSQSIMCNHANFTIDNEGTLVIQSTNFIVKGNSTFDLDNMADCSLTGTSIEVIGGYAYLQNTGTLNVQNGYFKDQFDGTFFANYGEVELSETTFVANGAEGKIELFNSGDLQISHCVFDVNYGGTVNMNSATGILTMTECSMDVSGSSHGSVSNINIIGDKATWESCSLVNNNGFINYLNQGELGISNCTVSMTTVDSSTILTSSGPMTFEGFVLSGSGSTSITSWDSMKLVDNSWNSSHSLTLMNNGELTADNWLVKTTSDNARVTIYNGNNATMSFDVPFIEDVSSSVLTSVGPEGQEFVESSGGIITVTNYGLMEKQVSSTDSLEYLLYILIIVIAVSVALFIIFKNRKKSSDQ